jgi:hypothetical protein
VIDKVIHTCYYIIVRAREGNKKDKKERDMLAEILTSKTHQTIIIQSNHTVVLAVRLSSGRGYNKFWAFKTRREARKWAKELASH